MCLNKSCNLYFSLCALQRSDEARKERKARDKDRDKEPDSEKEQEKEGEDRRKPKVKESNVAASGVDSPHTKERMKRERSNSPAKRYRGCQG